jgi:hypothetical protein
MAEETKKKLTNSRITKKLFFLAMTSYFYHSRFIPVNFQLGQLGVGLGVGP